VLGFGGFLSPELLVVGSKNSATQKYLVGACPMAWAFLQQPARLHSPPPQQLHRENNNYDKAREKKE
jgi:hypothetical protein